MCFQIDPLNDPRWEEFVQRHDASSVFHTTAWLSALHKTYGHKPVVFTLNSPGEDLTNGVPFCLVSSLWTGRRLVSLPFSDHCQPLFDGEEQLPLLLRFISKRRESQSYKYFEIRPIEEIPIGPKNLLSLSPYESYFLHRLKLTIDPNQLLNQFHKSCIQRKIRRAKREGLVYEEGRSEERSAIDAQSGVWQLRRRPALVGAHQRDRYIPQEAV